MNFSIEIPDEYCEYCKTVGISILTIETHDKYQEAKKNKFS